MECISPTPGGNKESIYLSTDMSRKYETKIKTKYVFYMVCHKLAIGEDKGGSNTSSLTHRPCKCTSEGHEKKANVYFF